MKITPRTRPDIAVSFETLQPGNTFLFQGGIWMVLEDVDQGGVNLSTGEYQTEMCEEIVVPVDAALTWKRKETTKKKK